MNRFAIIIIVLIVRRSRSARFPPDENVTLPAIYKFKWQRVANSIRPRLRIYFQLVNNRDTSYIAIIQIN